MGLKCRLLGHTYENPEVERNREERGDEVVVTIREVQTCVRCGDEQVVSQNKEVTTIRSPAEVGLDESAAQAGGSAGPASAEGDESAAAAAGETASRPGEDRSAGEAADAPSDAEADPAATTETEADPGAESPSTAASADGEAIADATETVQAIDEAEADDGWETGSDNWEGVETDPDADDAVILDGEAGKRDETQWPEETDADPTQAAAESAAAEEDATPSEDADEEVTNDAEIIDAEDGSGPGATEMTAGRERGEWHGRDAGSSGWPDHDGDDEGFDATTDDTDVELGGGGLTPEVNGHAGADHEESIDGIAAEAERSGSPQSRPDRKEDPTAAQETDSGQGFKRANESTTLESDVPDDRVEFYCPNCGHARLAGASSMRAGDICPECKQGYIAERER
ncbi:MAG: hypothetical protein ABEI27_06750 [Halobellus sp.]|uniref:DUF7093 family protein n=1 Tax=Halobellus sp. TaxID=1979212 RepID=UPI0035D50AB9